MKVPEIGVEWDKRIGYTICTNEDNRIANRALAPK